ncbi:TPA: hypothetical protein ACJG1V_004305, partial [Salmonella enterica subsp. enterica]
TAPDKHTYFSLYKLSGISLSTFLTSNGKLSKDKVASMPNMLVINSCDFFLLPQHNYIVNKHTYNNKFVSHYPI